MLLTKLQVLLFVLIVSTPIKAVERLSLFMYQEHINSITQKDTAECKYIDHYTGGNQIYVEFLLLCEALYLGGIEAPIDILAIPSQSRAINELIKGNGVSSGFTFWNKDLDKKLFYVTRATLEPGQFRKALYTTQANAQKFKELSVEHLLERSVIVNTEWRADIKALSCFKNKYFSGAKYGNMLAMVGQEKVELILHNVAHTNDMRHVFEAPPSAGSGVFSPFSRLTPFRCKQKTPHRRADFFSAGKRLRYFV